MAAHLRNNRNAVLLSSDQVTSATRKAIIAMHIKPVNSARVQKELKAAFPNARAFVEPMGKAEF